MNKKQEVKNSSYEIEHRDLKVSGKNLRITSIISNNPDIFEFCFIYYQLKGLYQSRDLTENIEVLFA